MVVVCIGITMRVLLGVPKDEGSEGVASSRQKCVGTKKGKKEGAVGWDAMAERAVDGYGGGGGGTDFTVVMSFTVVEIKKVYGGGR
ncbi:hypothetical protein L1987_07886 [Smallanthus sonchifolius]|uniref:Uncharacterized protein n=1 Tax=Smallanthus sonchifolius TaxID=185202 RepID=A0ACB9JLC1_9ASTR|nr:hypothetical protein L1987_07886 [Smallanthus sonchifolius]